MAELYEDWLTGPMTRTEIKELGDEDKKERRRLKKKLSHRKKFEENPEKSRENGRKYYNENKEKEKKRRKKFIEDNPNYMSQYNKKHSQSPRGKKLNTLSQWKRYGLQESPEDLEWIYELYLHQELCYSCDVKLSRNGDNHSTQACLDHCHITRRFRQICCRDCNNQDRWMRFWC